MIKRINLSFLIGTASIVNINVPRKSDIQMLCFALAIFSACTEEQPITLAEGMTKVKGSISLAWTKFCKFMETHFGPVFKVVKYISKTISLIFRTLGEDIKETAKIIRCIFANLFKSKKATSTEASVPPAQNNVSRESKAADDTSKIEMKVVESNVENGNVDTEIVVDAQNVDNGNVDQGNINQGNTEL